MLSSGLNQHINKAFCNLGNNRLQIPFIRSFQQGAPKTGKDLYATVNVVHLGSDGWDELLYTPKDPDDLDVQDLNETASGRENFMVSVNFFSVTGNISEDNVMDLGMAFKKYLNSSEACLELMKRQIGLGLMGNVRDLTVVENAEFEARAQIDFNVNVAVDSINEVLEIEEATIKGEYEQSGESVSASVQINFAEV